jgi:hypothetical protein
LLPPIEGMQMRKISMAMVAVFGLTGTAIAQNTDENSIPREIGNRANGKSYQPTPAEVHPREKAVDIRPSQQQEQAEDKELHHLDKSLLRSEGLSTKSVPNMTNDH